MFRRWRFGPIAASILAGFVGAAVVDFAVTLVRATGGAAPISLFALSIGLYGAVGLLCAAGLGLIVSGVLRAIPGGAAGLVGDERRDRAAATGILAGVAGTVVMAVVVAAGQKVLVRPMQSDKLATIAAAGLVLLAAPLGGRSPWDCLGRSRAG